MPPSNATKREPDIPAAMRRPSSKGCTASLRQCRTNVGARTLRSSSVTSMSSRAIRMRAAFSGVVVVRCSSLNQRACSNVAPGMTMSIEYPLNWKIRAALPSGRDARRCRRIKNTKDKPGRCQSLSRVARIAAVLRRPGAGGGHTEAATEGAVEIGQIVEAAGKRDVADLAVRYVGAAQQIAGVLQAQF